MQTTQNMGKNSTAQGDKGNNGSPAGSGENLCSEQAKSPDNQGHDTGIHSVDLDELNSRNENNNDQMADDDRLSQFSDTVSQKGDQSYIWQTFSGNNRFIF